MLLVVAGCTKRPISANEVSREERPDVEMRLADGTFVRLEDAQSSEGSICGRLLTCSGRSCPTVRMRQCVTKEDIATIHVHEVNKNAIAAGVIVGISAAVVVGAVIVSTNNSHEKTHSDYAPSRTTSTYGDGLQGSFGSCPRIYSWSGEGWRLDSGTYGLSYFEAAPRTDFDRLDHVAADHGAYRLRLVNEEDETEHTDLVRLRVVDHPAGTRIVPTESGQLLTFRDEVTPREAKDLRGRDALDLVRAADNREWTSDLEDRRLVRASDARDGLRFVFAKPHDAKLAKLSVAAHNTKWAGQMLGYLLAHRGPDLPAWWARMNADAKARGEFEAFMAREGMLQVRVRTSAGWKTRAVFWPAGPEIAKEEAFELAVDDVPGDTVEIELESALDFWSIDAASMAYGENEPILVRDLSPTSARTDQGKDITALLAQADGQRFTTVRGEGAELVFTAPAPAAAGSRRSFIVETKGYDLPNITPAPDADPAAMDALLHDPFAASRLALAFHLMP